MKPIRKLLKPIYLVLLLSYAVRIYKPSVFISDVDYSGHVVASLRLFLTSLFEIHKPTANLLVQLFSFSHGYTTIGVPAILYGFFFKLLRFPITEPGLVYINSLIGIASIATFYLFARNLYNERVALWSSLLYGLLPIHISLSRLHVGNQIIQSIFFFLSGAFLFRFLKTKKTGDKIWYFAFVFFLIGSDNAFPIALCLQLLLVVFSNERTRHSFRNAIRTIAFPLYISLPPVFGPIIMYLLMDIARIVKYGATAPGGFLLRTLTKTSHFVFSPVRTFQWALELIGPAIVCFVIILVYTRVRSSHRERFLLISILIYCLFLSVGANIERNYIFYIAGSVVLYVVSFLDKNRILLVGLCLITGIYSASVIYSVPIGFDTTKTYGSMPWNQENNDAGVKTLGYLVRKGMVPVGLTVTKQVTKLNICFDFLGGWYYLGNYYFDIPQQDMLTIKIKQDALFVSKPTSLSIGNKIIDRFVAQNHLYKIGTIIKGKKALLNLYSYNKQKLNEYQMEEYNRKFDLEYGNVEGLAKLYLGIY